MVYELVRGLPNRKGILEFPLPGSGPASRSMLNQTFHEYPIVGGYLIRVPPEAEARSREIVKWIFPGDILQPEGWSPLQLTRYGVGAIILHKDLVGLAASKTITEYLARNLGSPIFVGEDTVAFLLPEDAAPDPLQYHFQLEGEWYELEIRDGIPSRWIGNQATIVLHDSMPGPARISFSASAFNRPRRFVLEVNGLLAGEFEAPQDVFSTFTSERVDLAPGDNRLTFRILPGCQVPLAIGSGLDARCLSVAIQIVEVNHDESTSRPSLTRAPRLWAVSLHDGGTESSWWRGARNLSWRKNGLPSVSSSTILRAHQLMGNRPSLGSTLADREKDWINPPPEPSARSSLPPKANHWPVVTQTVNTLKKPSAR